jgi:ribosomal protein S6--L-glutamate ligase
MKICLLAEPNPSPVLTSALGLLAERNTVLVRDPQTLTGGFAGRSAELGDVDMYLLKSRSTAALTYAADAQAAGSVVLNSPAATSAALDRATMATLLRRANVAAPYSGAADSLAQLARSATAGTVRPGLSWPLVIKSQRSRRGDLVTLVTGNSDLQALLPRWADEPVIAQEFIPNDGFDLKFWVIDEQVTVARRPGALEDRTTAHDVALDPGQLPPDWISTVLDAGAALGLDIFGADALITDNGPIIIDVNAFPGFRSAAGADFALADLVERRAAERRLCA